MTRRSSVPSQPPDAMRRRGLRSDTIALLPASLLPFTAPWRRLTDGVASREALCIVPEGETPLRQTMRQLVPHLRACGRQVTALSARRFG